MFLKLRLVVSAALIVMGIQDISSDMELRKLNRAFQTRAESAVVIDIQNRVSDEKNDAAPKSKPLEYGNVAFRTKSGVRFIAQHVLLPADILDKDRNGQEISVDYLPEDPREIRFSNQPPMKTSFIFSIVAIAIGLWIVLTLFRRKTK